MPELPEVETVRRGLERAMLGSQVTRVELRRSDIRIPFPPRFKLRLEGRRIVGLTRRAKYLLFNLDSDETLIAHLGMSGSFRTEISSNSGLRSKNPRHDHVVFHLDNGNVVKYNDPRRFGFMDLISNETLEGHPSLRKLGEEPLAPEFDATRLAKLFADARTSLKSGLLDQKRVAGLGNIYVCEALFRARLSPSKRADVLSNRAGAPTRAAAVLHAAIRDVLIEAIEAGGSTLRDHSLADGRAGHFQYDFAVYDREGLPCPRRRCHGTIARITQSGRSTFYCPKCQK